MGGLQPFCQAAIRISCICADCRLRTFRHSGQEGTIFKTDPTIEYFIEREDAKVVFLRYRKTTEELEQSVILTEVKNAYKDVAGLYETDSLINNRPAFEKEVEALLKERPVPVALRLPTYSRP